MPSMVPFYIERKGRGRSWSHDVHNPHQPSGLEGGGVPVCPPLKDAGSLLVLFCCWVVCVFCRSMRLCLEVGRVVEAQYVYMCTFVRVCVCVCLYIHANCWTLFLCVFQWEVCQHHSQDGGHAEELVSQCTTPRPTTRRSDGAWSSP